MGILKITPAEVSDSVVKGDDNTYNFNSNFDKRLRLQKVVFLIEHKTKEFSYPFSLYLRGPYSKELAKEYYNMTTDSYSESEQSLSEEAKELANILSEKDNLWLEIASTIVMFSDSYSAEEAVARTREFKEDILSSKKERADLVDSVYEEIKRMGCL